MAIETLSSLALDAGRDIFAPTPRNDTPISAARRGTEMYEVLTGGLRSAGPVVNEKTAMAVSAVYACVGLISGAVASSPLHVYERTADGRQRAEVDEWWLLNEQPNSATSAAVMWTMLMESLLLQGDMFAVLQRGVEKSPKICEILPVLPRQVVDVLDDQGKPIYVICPDTGQPYGVEPKNMLHVPGAGFDGKRGMSAVKHAARQAVGIAIAADEYNARFFTNGARPDFILRTDAELSQEQVDQLRESWAARYGGVERSHLPAVLQGGLDVKALTVTAEDAQLIATREFQVEDIARIFGVPPFMIGHTEKTTSWGSGVESMGIGFVKYTLLRHLVKIQQEINRKFWPIRERYFVEFETGGLERGDLKGRYDAYRLALGGSSGPGFLTQDEIRRLENRPPLGGPAAELTTWRQNDAQKQDPQP
jgi:HK97 family phage portal protein